MFKSIVSTVALSTLAAYVSAQGLIINTPAQLVQCQPVMLAWSGGQPNYYVTALPGGQPSGGPLATIGQFDGTSTTWTPDLAPGTSVTMSVTDGTGAINYSAQVTVIAGQTSDCSSASSSSGGDAAPAAAAADPAAASSEPAIPNRRTKVLPGQSSPAAAAAAAATQAATGAVSPVAAAAATSVVAASPARVSVVTVQSTLSYPSSAPSSQANKVNGAARSVAAGSAVFAGIVAFIALA